MEKVIRDGLVGILVSPGFGAGWSTWNDEHPELLFSPKVIEMVESGRAKEIDGEWCLENLGIAHVYCGGASDLVVKWIPAGTPFYIHEYDGSESIKTSDNFTMSA